MNKWISASSPDFPLRNQDKFIVFIQDTPDAVAHIRRYLDRVIRALRESALSDKGDAALLRDMAVIFRQQLLCPNTTPYFQRMQEIGAERRRLNALVVEARKAMGELVQSIKDADGLLELVMPGITDGQPSRARRRHWDTEGPAGGLDVAHDMLMRALDRQTDSHYAAADLLNLSAKLEIKDRIQFLAEFQPGRQWKSPGGRGGPYKRVMRGRLHEFVTLRAKIEAVAGTLIDLLERVRATNESLEKAFRDPGVSMPMGFADWFKETHVSLNLPELRPKAGSRHPEAQLASP